MIEPKIGIIFLKQQIEDGLKRPVNVFALNIDVTERKLTLDVEQTTHPLDHPTLFDTIETMLSVDLSEGIKLEGASIMYSHGDITIVSYINDNGNKIKKTDKL